MSMKTEWLVGQNFTRTYRSIVQQQFDQIQVDTVPRVIRTVQWHISSSEQFAVDKSTCIDQLLGQNHLDFHWTTVQSTFGNPHQKPYLVLGLRKALIGILFGEHSVFGIRSFRCRLHEAPGAKRFSSSLGLRHHHSFFVYSQMLSKSWDWEGGVPVKPCCNVKNLFFLFQMICIANEQMKAKNLF